jgi:hypothetical protein
MKIYKVAVASLDGVVYQSGDLAGFESAKSALIEQILKTGGEAFDVTIEDLEEVLPAVEDLTEENFNMPFMLSDYVHIILPQGIDLPWEND